MRTLTHEEQHRIGGGGIVYDRVVLRPDTFSTALHAATAPLRLVARSALVAR